MLLLSPLGAFAGGGGPGATGAAENAPYYTVIVKRVRRR